MRAVLATCLLFASTPLIAQQDTGGPTIPNGPTPAGAPNDGRATASPAIIAIIAAARQRPIPIPVLQPQDAEQIRSLVLADGKIDDAEFDLLDELASNTIRNIRISAPGGKGPEVVTAAVSGQPRRIFDTIFQQHYLTNWEAKDQAAGWTEIIRQAKFSDSAHSRVRKFLAKFALDAATTSNNANAYGPVTSLIIEFSKRNDKLPDVDRVIGRRLMYEAFSDADAAQNGNLPDWLYTWLGKPPAKPASGS